MENDELASRLRVASAILFDFDGPICSVFSGLPADGIARHLATAASEYNLPLGRKLQGIDDPLEVLRLVHQVNRDLSRMVEDELTKAEVRAVESASPTDGASQALHAAHQSDRAVAVVSNNSAECVRSYLIAHDLSRYVDQVVGRPEGHPERMKPDPYSVTRSVVALDRSPNACSLIGDSVTDVEAAQAAGTSSIGFANKPGKRELLTMAGADAVTASMFDVARVLMMPRRSGPTA